MRAIIITAKSMLVILLVLTASCKEFITIDKPKDQIDTKKVYANDETAIAAIRGIYSKMMSEGGFASGLSYSISISAGRSADEFNNLSIDDSKMQFSNNTLLPENIFMRQALWQEPYQVIYYANAILENLALSNKISVTVKQQLTGEAKFLRAFCYFYLSNLFSNVPLILHTDYRLNATAAASTTEQIYLQMVKDLTEAKGHLLAGYPSGERIRANKWAAAALLARVYLYHQDWENAENESTELIAQHGIYELANDLSTVFLANSKEAILQFAVPSALGYNTGEGLTFIIDETPGVTADVSLNPDLVAAFEPDDLRLANWVGAFTSGTKSWYFPFKYKVKTGSTTVTEYSMVLRLAEQYLIRAEARINLNKIDLGIEDLNVLRTRARSIPTLTAPDPLPNLPATLNKANALLAVEKERRLELFSEWGHRWFDLKRTNRADAVLAPIKAPNWQSADGLYPIPATELSNNNNLIQNKGY